MRNKKVEQLSKFPREVSIVFMNFFQDRERVSNLKKQLIENATGVMLQYKDYQLSVTTVSELSEYVEYYSSSMVEKA